MNEFVSAASSCACSAAVLTWAVGGTFSGARGRAAHRTRPASPPGDLVELAALAEQLLRGREVETGERCPADGRHRAEADEAREPEQVGRAFGLDFDPLAEPAIFSLSAVDSSTTTSPGPGQEPSTSVSGLKRDVPEAMLKPRLGAPPYTIALPSLPINCAWPSTLPSAASTSGECPHGIEERFVQRRGGGADVLEGRTPSCR